MAPTQLKIAFIGGGSRAWARNLMFDLALTPDLTGEMALYDIDRPAAELNARLGEWLQHQPGVVSRWHYRAADSLPAALTGADFVIISIQPGPLELMQAEIAIAGRFGRYFPVGDTSGAPGLVRGLRSAVMYKDFAEKIAEHCPNAWVINYTNPMTICTRTLTRVAPGLKVFGCCHEVFAVQKMLAELVQQYGLAETAPPRDEIEVNVLGLNHFTWLSSASWRGQDLFPLIHRHLHQPGVLRTFTRQEVESWHDWFKSANQVKFRLFQRYGLLGAAGDRHLVEFLPGFIHSAGNLFKWGVIRTPIRWRIARWRAAARHARGLISGRVPLQLQPSGEAGVRQLKALLGMGDLVTNANFPNRSQMLDLPPDVVVETNVRFSRDAVTPLPAGSFPAGLAPLVQQHSANQELIITAALTGDRDLAFQAVFADPTTGLDLDAAWCMFAEMLAAGQEYLPFTRP